MTTTAPPDVIIDDVLTEIVKWNVKRNILALGFNLEKEMSFVIEELLEMTGRYNSKEARDPATHFARLIIGGLKTEDHSIDLILGSLGDIAIYVPGAMAKLGYDPKLVMNEVLKEINARTGELIDGKFVKDENAVVYEPDFSKCKLRE